MVVLGSLLPSPLKKGWDKGFTPGVADRSNSVILNPVRYAPWGTWHSPETISVVTIWVVGTTGI